MLNNFVGKQFLDLLSHLNKEYYLISSYLVTNKHNGILILLKLKSLPNNNIMFKLKENSHGKDS